MTVAQAERLRLIHWAINKAHEELMQNDLSSVEGIRDMRESLTNAMNLIGRALDRPSTHL
jgi:hypothetical protein